LPGAAGRAYIAGQAEVETMKRILAACAALAAMAATAKAAEPSEAQENVIRHIVEAALLAKMCPGAAVNEGEMAALMAWYDLPKDSFAENGPYHAAVVRIAAKAKADAGGFSTYQACTAATAMYGPRGGNVPDLVRQKD
jgi:hypothetical protein